MVMKIVDTITERWTNWRTKTTAEERRVSNWLNEHIVYRANDITNMFAEFKYIINVNPYTFFNYAEPFSWVPCSEAKNYFYPARELGDNCVWTFQRVLYNSHDQRWHINEMFGADKVFVATNSDEDAIMIALKWAGQGEGQ